MSCKALQFSATHAYLGHINVAADFHTINKEKRKRTHFIPCSSLSNYSTQSLLSLLSSALLSRLKKLTARNEWRNTNYLSLLWNHELLCNLYIPKPLFYSVLKIWAISSTKYTRLCGDDFLDAAQLELSVLLCKGRVDRRTVFPQCESKCVASGYCSWWIPADTTDMGTASEGIQKRRKKRQEGEQLQQKWRKEPRYPHILSNFRHLEPEPHRWLAKSLILQKKLTREESYYGAFWILS